MKTKDFIAMLQKEDPSGEGHIRMYGGVPYFAEAKQGYWDGAYQYIDEQGNFVTSTEGYKIDINCIDIEDFVERNMNIYEENNWEYIKSKIKFKTYGGAVNDDREKSILKSAKEFYDEMVKIDLNTLDESTKLVLDRYEKGWLFFQEKDTKLIYHRWLLIQPNGKDNNGSSSQHDTNGIIHSNLFEKLDNNVKEGYYQWVKK